MRGWQLKRVASIEELTPDPALQATRRLMADRFYTKDFTSATYTAEGLSWIANASMKSVILRHSPPLRYTGLAAVDNAFYPWQ